VRTHLVRLALIVKHDIALTKKGRNLIANPDAVKINFGGFLTIGCGLDMDEQETPYNRRRTIRSPHPEQRCRIFADLTIVIFMLLDRFGSFMLNQWSLTITGG
jgi:hypothetical protein